MSVQSMIRRQGTQVSIYRGTAVTSADKNRTLGAPWTLIAVAVWLNLQGLGFDAAQKVFGTQEVVEADGFAFPDADLQRDDRVVVTAGPYLTLKLRVVERKPHRQGSASDHLEVALQSTTETFP